MMDILFNPFKPHGISHCYQLDQSIYVLRVFLMVIFYIFIQISKANSGDPGQTPHSVVSDLDLHCLPMPHKKNTRLISDKLYIHLTNFCTFYRNFLSQHLNDIFLSRKCCLLFTSAAYIQVFV